jgi:hypothetical protein
VSTRFRVDLLHPGADLRQMGWVAQSWAEWFTGPDAPRRLALFSLACAAVLVVMLVAVILPPYWRLSSDLNAVPGLRRDVAARQTDLDLLKSNLEALSEEARRQIRWGELLATLSQQVPPVLKLQSVDAVRSAPPRAAGQPQSGTPVRAENTLRIEAVTPLRPGSPPLLEVAQFIAGLMRDPTVNKRFQLRSWELKPGPDAGPGGGGQLLNIIIVLTERV